MVAVVSRLTEQKGLDMMEAGLEAALARGAQVVLLGSAPDPAVHARFEAAARDAARGPSARYILAFDEGLARRIYAAADILLVPSRFEPCGLAQAGRGPGGDGRGGRARSGRSGTAGNTPPTVVAWGGGGNWVGWRATPRTPTHAQNTLHPCTLSS